MPLFRHDILHCRLIMSVKACQQLVGMPCVHLHGVPCRAYCTLAGTQAWLLWCNRVRHVAFRAVYSRLPLCERLLPWLPDNVNFHLSFDSVCACCRQRVWHTVELATIRCKCLYQLSSQPGAHHSMPIGCLHQPMLHLLCSCACMEQRAM